MTRIWPHDDEWLSWQSWDVIVIRQHRRSGNLTNQCPPGGAEAPFPSLRGIEDDEAILLFRGGGGFLGITKVNWGSNIALFNLGGRGVHLELLG